jgi:hypothetical protein
MKRQNDVPSSELVYGIEEQRRELPAKWVRWYAQLMLRRG